ncbi:MAG: radical SAM protein [Anaerolineae bacterium]|nr:radical SAM protein [Anaerolineae bacterium]
MLELLPRLPLYESFYHLGWPYMLPFSIVVSVSYRCNSRCQTCNVWQRSSEEMTAAEWRQVFAHLGRAPFYLTFTGGEPFLRADLPELVAASAELCRPSVITIPTNGLLTGRIVDYTGQICTAAPWSQIGLNLSLDGIGPEHDEIRGIPGNWRRAMETWRGLKELQAAHKNLVLSVHTVISRLNVGRIRDIVEGLASLEPDSYITEVAEERVELGTVGCRITPTAEEYAPIADYLSTRAGAVPAKGLARFTQAFRAQYYQLAKRILQEHRQVIPCQAGWASGHIAPDGDVWTCCVRAEPVGNLRQAGYDLRPIWFEQAGDIRRLRASIAGRECACPMANASYANMLLHPPTVVRVAGQIW